MRHPYRDCRHDHVLQARPSAQPGDSKKSHTTTTIPCSRMLRKGRNPLPNANATLMALMNTPATVANATMANSCSRLLSVAKLDSSTSLKKAPKERKLTNAKALEKSVRSRRSCQGGLTFSFPPPSFKTGLCAQLSQHTMAKATTSNEHASHRSYLLYSGYLELVTKTLCIDHTKVASHGRPIVALHQISVRHPETAFDEFGICRRARGACKQRADGRAGCLCRPVRKKVRRTEQENEAKKKQDRGQCDGRCQPGKTGNTVERCVANSEEIQQCDESAETNAYLDGSAGPSLKSRPRRLDQI